jgi:hypothetical protein
MAPDKDRERDSLCYVNELMVVWARLMEWRYPVEVIVTSKTTFEMAGLAEAAILGARNLRR